MYHFKFCHCKVHKKFEFEYLFTRKIGVVYLDFQVTHVKRCESFIKLAIVCDSWKHERCLQKPPIYVVHLILDIKVFQSKQ